MNQELIDYIKKLQNIQPDPIFREKCRTAVLSYKTKKPFWRMPVLAWSGVFAILALIFATGIAIFSKPKEAFSSFDEHKINKEFANLNINIQLNEIKYQQKVNQTINSALTEISESQIKHLNIDVLEKEKNEIDASSTEINQIEELLNQVVF
jgi:hypothetical protein